MADVTKNVKMGLSVDDASVKAAVEKVKAAVQEAFKNINLGEIGGKIKETMEGAKQATSEYSAATKEAKNSINEMANSQTKANETLKNGHQNLLHLHEGLKGYIAGVKNLLQVQLMWYAAKPITMLVLQTPVEAIKMAYEYTKVLDDANRGLLRWDATSGQVTEDMKVQVKSLVLEMQKAVLDVPVKFEDLFKVVEGFKGAGVAIDTIKGMTRELGILASSFKEIPLEKFSIAVTGLFNVFKNDLTGTDSQKFKDIIGMLLKASAEGVIRPENFVKVAQYMGEMGHIAGLSIPEILALNVAITNTGVTAQSASRLLATFIGRLTQAKTRALLLRPELQIKLDPNQNFEEQINDILKQLGEKLAIGGQTRMGALGFITGISGPQGAKILLPLIEQLKDIQGLTERITKGANPYDVLNKVNVESISGQWQLLQNTVRELAKDSSNADTIIKPLVGTLLKLARAALYAVNPTLATAENLSKLSGAGRNVYNLMLEFIPTVKAAGEAFLGIMKAMGGVIGFLGQFNNAIALVADVMIARAILQFTGLSRAIAAVTVALRAMTIAEAAAAGLAALLNPVTLIAIGIGGIAFAWERALKKVEEYKTAQVEALEELKKNLPTMTDAIVKQTYSAIVSEIADLEAKSKPHAEAKGGSVQWYTGLSEQQRIRLEALKQEKALIEQQQAAEKTTATSPAGKNIPFPDQASAHQGQLIAAARERRAALLAIDKSYLAAVLAQQEDWHKLGLTSDANYYAAKEQYIKDVWEKEKKDIKAAQEEIEDAYKKATAPTAKALTSQEREALDKKKGADLEQNRARNVEAENKAFIAITNNQIAQEQTRLAIAKEFGDAQLTITKTMLDARMAITEGVYKREEEWNNYLYQHGYINAAGYYSKVNELIQKEAALKKQAIQDEMMLQVSALHKQAEGLALGDSEKRNALTLKKKEVREKAGTDMTKVDVATAEKQQQQAMKTAQDIKSIYEAAGGGAEGMIAVAKKAADEMTRVYSNAAQNVREAMMGGFQGIDRTLTQFFDTSKQNAHAFRDLMTSVMNTILREMEKLMLVKPIMAGLTNMMSGGRGGFMGGVTGSFQGLFGAGVDMNYTPSSMGELMGMGSREAEAWGYPAYAEGSDYVPRTGLALIHQGEKITPSGQNGGGNHIVNIINNHRGAEVTSSKPKFDFNLDAYITNVYIRDRVQGGPMTQADKMLGGWNG